MNEQTTLALATCNGNSPNVRIVNFYYKPETNTIFFTSFADNAKVKELEENPNVAFTTIPNKGEQHIKAQGVATKSCLTIFDVAKGFTDKIDGYAETLTQIGEYLVLFEISFKTAVVTISLENIEALTF